MTIIELLKRWSELEPTRVEVLTVSTARWPEDIGQFYIQVQPDDRRVLRVDEPFGFSTTATLCAVIEAAIVEREWWLTVRYQRGSWSEGVEWDCRICIFDECGEGNDIFQAEGPIKLEALLSAYVQALEASK